MFEAHVLHLLRLYLGEYVRGLSVEALKISVWKGDVVLKDLQLKAEALNALKLPITVKAGFLGSVTLKVPWNRLGKDPVIVLLDRIFVLAEPLRDERSFTKEDKDRWFEVKRRKCEEAELAKLAATDVRTAGAEPASNSNTWFGSLIATIVGNLKISITNLHIRYEDTVSNPGHPFCSGVTLGRLAAVTIDEVGTETFVTSGALERLRKSVQLERLSVYHDSDSLPWKLDKLWVDMSPQEWSEIFEEGIAQDACTNMFPSKWATGRQYLLHPVGGLLTHFRRGKREKRSTHVPFQEASLLLEAVTVTVSEAQYCDGMKLLEGISSYRNRLQYVQFRPQVSVSEDPRAWWLYGCQAVLQQQMRVWYRLSWSKIIRLCGLRRKYVQLYASCLQQSFKVDNQEIKDMEKELDFDVILLWRLLAHARVESAKSKEAAIERERLRNSPWWTFGWGTLNPAATTHKETEVTPIGHLTNEEWNKINSLLSYQPEEDTSKQEAPDMMQFSLDVRVQQCTARVLDRKKMEILCGTFEDLQVGLKVYPKTLACEGKLQFYGLSAPEGVLIESVSREGRDYALASTFVHLPFEEDLDWKLTATMSPCHVKIWRVSFERFLQFLKSSQALSPGVALETAAVLQSKLEEVTRRAQEQLQLAIEKQSRFSVDLDLDAPKIMIPAKIARTGGDDTQLLLDLGHFTLHTAHDALLDTNMSRPDIYSRFFITGKEISAFLVDGKLQWSDIPSLSSPSFRGCVVGHDSAADSVQSNHGGTVLPVLDRCGMSLVLDQIQMQHSCYPSTRLAIKVPRLGLHFSPARYSRLMLILHALGAVSQLEEGLDAEKDTAMPVQWQHGDYSGEARILLWGGIGSTIAEWQPCWVVLVGTYLYILESENAKTYQRCSSMSGKQVMEVPLTNIGGFECVIAICHRGVDHLKVVESSGSLVMQLKNEEVKTAWMYYIALAAYKASGPVPLPLPSELSENDDAKNGEPDALESAKQPQLFVMGHLQELNVSISTLMDVGGHPSTSGEKLILELQAYGGKVDLLQRQYDTSVSLKLHSLRIEDKLQGHVAPSCQYLARSALSSTGRVDIEESNLPDRPAHEDIGTEEDEDIFDDALMDLPVPDSPSSSDHGSFHRLFSSGRTDLTGNQDKALHQWEVELLSLSKVGTIQGLWVESEDEEAFDFVNMRLIIRHTASPDYDGSDVQMSIRMATLEFFCNRPTVVALIKFGIDVSESYPGETLNAAQSGEDNATQRSPVPRDIVKGLLGEGKSRVMFRLKLDMESARIFVNMEDGSQIAMLAQEKFRMDLKVYPGSLTISGTLGNLRVCDMFLGADHQWGWLCDIRDPGAASLVELEFQSYNRDEEGYQGFDYSLSGKLSAVRLVFLYRFIQEITTYFVALATPEAPHVVTVVDRVGGIEKLIQQADIRGASPVKLDFSLDTPIIIVPRCSNSREFMQLDLGHLEVHNTFEWHGGGKEVPSAVHLDVLHAEMTGINMVVGIDGQPGKSMIQEARGLQVKVQRPLRDVFKKVPEVMVDVQVMMLRGAMSHQEYLVIIECASTNVSELPNLPPTFREPVEFSEICNEERMLLELPGESKEETSAIMSDLEASSAAPSWTRVRATVDVQHVELKLFTGVDFESALARIEIQKLWLNYCNSTTLSTDLLITLSKISVLDQRWDTKPEMRLMLGSMADVEKNGLPSHVPYVDSESSVPDDLSPQLTMLIMDLHFKPNSQAVVIRVQRPRLLVVVDFLLAVAVYFVPSLGDVTGRNDSESSETDEFFVDNHLRLSTRIYKQEDEMVILSSDRQLVADAYDIDDYIYDGCGKTLCLNVKDDGYDSWEPLIIIGWRKRLHFKNVYIKNGLLLSNCIHLSFDSSYSASFDDGVILEGMGTDTSGGYLMQSLGYNDLFSSPLASPTTKKQMAALGNCVIDIQAVAPEFTFYDSTNWPSGSPGRERVLRANLDCYLMVAFKGNDRWIRGQVKGLTIEGGSGLVVVDPVDISAEYACVQDRMTMMVAVSDISMRLSFSVISLVLRFHDDALSTFHLAGMSPLSRCTHFDRIWANISSENPSQQVAIWRPRAPPGYMILGDCATSGVAPPAQAVMAISNTYPFAKKPLAFKLIWSSQGDTSKADNMDKDDDQSEHCCVWMPVAPPGYLALGCVAERGHMPPSPSVFRCIHSDLVTSGSLSDCIFYIPPDERGEHENGCSIWRMENVAGSFYAHSSIDPPARSLAIDICEMLQRTTSSTIDTERRDLRPDVASHNASLRKMPSSSRLDSTPGVKASSGRFLITTSQFERMWWDKEAEARRTASIWRPVVPAGYAIIGDCLVEGLEPPGVGVALRDEDSGRLTKPLRYLQRMHTMGKTLEDATFWFPVAPPGYVALGCVVTKTPVPPPLDLVRCVRVDQVCQSQLSKNATWWLSSEKKPNSVWSMPGSRPGYNCGLWKVENQACTFIARADLRRPPGRMAYALADGKKKVRDKLSVEVKISRISTTIFDDMAGLMTPLVDWTITNINLAAHGRMEAMSAVVVTSMAASTFNTQLESWEPLIEPFEGIFKYESFDVDTEATLRVGKRIRITAANIVNVNVTSAGLESLVEAVVSWRKQMELEQQARMSLEMGESDYKEPSIEGLSSALEENESQKLVFENRLGCDLYLRKFKDNFEQVELVHKDQSNLVHLPPPRFPDRFINVSDARPPRHFVAIHVSEAKDLPVNDDGNNQDYMCALRLVNTHSTDEQKALPQTARSRCVRPTTIAQCSGCLLADAKWNEVFVFELLQQASVFLEVLVSNQGAKGGKGQAIGVAAVPLNKLNGDQNLQPSSLWNLVCQTLRQGPVSSWPAVKRKAFSLVPPHKMNLPSDAECGSFDCGQIVVSMYFFSAKGNTVDQGLRSDTKAILKDADIGLSFGTSSTGPWTGIRSVLPLATVPIEVAGQQLALEVTMQQAHKSVKVRSLVMLRNNTDLPVDVCLCPFSLLNVPDRSSSITDNQLSSVVEEVFENQRYQPLAGGWGSRWPGHLMPNDPSRWSNQDYTRTSQDFLEPTLPLGWVWTSDWSIDKTSYVDADGWFYGADFQSLRYPPASMKTCRKSAFDFARRRRLVRTRQCVPETQYMHTRQMVGVVQPGASVALPWADSNAKADICVQVRPHSDSSEYSWGRAIGDVIAQSSSQNASNGPALSKNGVPVSSLPLRGLEKTEEILLTKALRSSSFLGICWLNLDVDATVLYRENNAPIPDWTITVNAPLKLENRLPCTAEYLIYEKPRSGNLLKQQHGIVVAGGSVHIYSVDVRRPIYLTWLAQGSWKPEKEVVVISDPAMEELPSGFWMIHQQSGRRLRVSLEHDFGGSNEAAKIIRLFVPYWLLNDASLPLAYRLVEIEPDRGLGGDATWLTRAAKAAKQAARRPNHAGARKVMQINRVVQHLECIEDLQGTPVMLSLQAYSDRMSGLSLSSRSEDGLLSPRLGLSVAIAQSNVFNHALSFRDFENSMERVNLNAVNSSGAYYKLSVFLDMSSDRTKVIHVQPHTLFVNRIGQRLSLRQGDITYEEMLYPNDPPKSFLWQSTRELELLKICVEGYKWSHPFSVDSEGLVHIILRREHDDAQLVIRAEVRNGVKGSRYLVVFRLASRQSPYRVENRSAVLPIRFRQADSGDDSWQLLSPGSAASFAWENVLLDHLLEILVDGQDPLRSVKYNIDEPTAYRPMPSFKGPAVALQTIIFKEGMFNVFRVVDWKPSNDNLSIVSIGAPNTPQTPTPESGSLENQFHTVIELDEFGLSIIDHTPEELLYVSIQNLVFNYATGLGSGTSRLKLRMDNFQVDCQIPLTPTPVLFIAQESEHRDFLLKCTITMQDNGVPDYFSYPYISIQGPNVPNVSFLVNIHEPIIWRLHEMFHRLSLGRLKSSQTTAVAIDPIICIGLLHTSEIRFKVTLAMAPAQRPRGILGFWSTLITSLGNTDEMPIRITPHVHEDVSMRQSALWAATFASIRNDLLSQPFQLLTGVDILGNTSSALGNMSKGVAALSMDKKFIRGRQKQLQGNVEDIGDGIREGGEAFAKGLFRGVTGIVTKPFEGARSSGMEGFLQGVGKGVIGVAIQPVSGVLDFLSKTTEGANAMRMKLAAAITFEQQLLRHRLPRVIGGDNVLRPYNDCKARGQVLMQLAERGTIFGPVDFFRVRGKFAMTDAYEDHFNLPKGRTLIITHRRVILLQHPASLIQQKKPDLLKEPCTVTWDVTWNEMMTMELVHAKESSMQSPPSRLIIHLRNWSQDSRLFDSKEITRVVKCHPGTQQAAEIRNAIQQAYDSYGNAAQGVHGRFPARKPYAGAQGGAASGTLALTGGPAAPILTSFGALEGPASQTMLDSMKNPQPQKADGDQPHTSSTNHHQRAASEGPVQRGIFVYKFERLWWDKGAPWSKKFQVSIWRPQLPSGYISVGDVVQSCYDQPEHAMVYHDDHSGKFSHPEGFDLVWRDTESGARDPVTIWRPRPQQRYVAIGCVVVPEYYEPDRSVVSCVHEDCVENVPLGQVPLWRDYTSTALWPCSLWSVQNDAGTFLARRDHQAPAPHLSYTVRI